jgi:hypothetical protein
MFHRAFTHLAATTFLFVASLSSGRAGTILFTQPPTPADEMYTTWESESGPDGVLGRTYDNFALPEASVIGSVIWVGNYIDSMVPARNPAGGDATSFEISFWSNDHGLPGTMLATSTIAVGATHQTALAKTKFELSTGNLVTIPQYAYNATLTTPFAADAGRTYWISIVANTPTDQPLWAWKSGTGGNKNSIQDFDGTRYVRQLDRSFALESAAPAKITVNATVPITHLDEMLPGIFTIKSSEPSAVATVIHYTLKGTAVNGEDYVRLPGMIKIKAHATAATVRIVPKGTLAGDVSKTVKLVLDPSPAYTVGAKAKALVTIDQ